MAVFAPLCLALLLGSVAADQLVLVQSLFRHGDRTPILTYPKDPYQESFWNMSWGQLTTEGMLQHYNQGLKVKQHYINQGNFMSADYHDYNIRVHSTDVDRTLMSAYSHLAGFYSDSKNTSPSITAWPHPWTPVPVHTRELNSDHLLNVAAHCPRRDQLHSELKKMPNFFAFMTRYKSLLQQISTESGIDTHEFDTFSHVERFYAGVSIEKFHNLTLPAWITDSLWKSYTEGKYQCDDYLSGSAAFGYGEQTELIRLKGGPLLQHMLDNIDGHIADSSRMKFHMYSAHDTTVGAFLRTLQAKDALIGLPRPSYAATVLVELWKAQNGSYSVRVQYIANSTAPIQSATHLVGGCGGKEFCPLDVFKTRSQAFLPGNIEHACKAK